MDVNRKDALAAVRVARKGVSSRPGIPALTGVKVTASGGMITLEATDLEVSVRTSFAGPGEYQALVPSKLLSDALSGSKSERVPFEPSSAGLEAVLRGEVSAGPESSFRVGSATIRRLPLDDFPNLVADGPTTAVDLEAFAGAVSAVLPAVSGDEARPALTGILLETGPDGMTVVGCDSYRLHVSELPSTHYPVEGRWIVPGRALKALLGIAGKKTAGRTIALELGTSDVAFTIDETTLRSRTIDGEYPNYRQLMPDNDATERIRHDGIETTQRNYGRLEVDPITFAAVVSEVGMVCRDTTPIRLSLNGTVELYGSSPDLGSAHAIVTDATWIGEGTADAPMVVAFNPTYFADAVSSVGATVCYVRDGLKPLVAVGPGGSALIMPVRLPAAVS
jgi:DNA polymerase-3 subunit beta